MEKGRRSDLLFFGGLDFRVFLCLLGRKVYNVVVLSARQALNVHKGGVVGGGIGRVEEEQMNLVVAFDSVEVTDQIDRRNAGQSVFSLYVVRAGQNGDFVTGAFKVGFCVVDRDAEEQTATCQG